MAIMSRNFEFSYESISTKSYLVASMDSDEEIIEYQVEMISKNPYPGILPVELSYKNDKTNLYYDISSKTQLSKLLKMKEFTSDEFITILHSICKAILDSKNLYLYDSSFLLHEDYVYVNLSTLEASILYMPLKQEQDVSSTFKGFLTNLIVHSVRLDEKSSGTFLQKILNHLKKDSFNIADFMELLEQLRGNKLKDQSIPKMQQQPRPMQKNILKSIPKISKPKEVHAPKSQPSHNNSQQKEKVKEVITKKVYKPLYIVIAALSQIIILTLLLLGKDSLANISEDITTTYAGIGIAIVAIDFLLFRSLFKKENMIEKTIEKSKKVSKSDDKSKGEKSPKDEKKEQKTIINKREIVNNRDVQMLVSNYSSVDQPTGIISVKEESNDTVILDSEEQVQTSAYLLKEVNGTITKISINKSVFRIGRHSDYADYIINNGAVGRFHAEIIFREGSYFVVDQNSKNGTYVNGERIPSNQECRIENEDNVTFANTSFVFSIR